MAHKLSPKLQLPTFKRACLLRMRNRAGSSTSPPRAVIAITGPEDSYG